MVTKGLIILAALITIARRSLAFTCVRCPHDYHPNGTLIDHCGPPPTCSYGLQIRPCGCCEVCAKGPGESCGGEWGFSGRCGTGLECHVALHYSGHCRAKAQQDDLDPSTTITLLDTTTSEIESLTGLPGITITSPSDDTTLDDKLVNGPAGTITSLSETTTPDVVSVTRSPESTITSSSNHTTSKVEFVTGTPSITISSPSVTLSPNITALGVEPLTDPSANAIIPSSKFPMTKVHSVILT